MPTIEVDPDDIGTPDEPATLPSTQESGYFTAPIAPRAAQGMAAVRPQQQEIDWDQIAGSAKPTPKAKQAEVSWDDIAPAAPTPGNVDLAKQPRVNNPDGTYSTVDSRSYNIDGKEVLLPAVTADGRHLQTDAEILAEYKRTGKHLGIFPDVASATAYAKQLHDNYATGKYGAGGPDAAVKEMEFGLTHPAAGGTTGVTSAPSALAAPARSGAFSPLELETIAKSAPVGQTFVPPTPQPPVAQAPSTADSLGRVPAMAVNPKTGQRYESAAVPNTGLEPLVSGPEQAIRGAAGLVSAAATAPPRVPTTTVSSKTGQSYATTVAPPPADETLRSATDLLNGLMKTAAPAAVRGAIQAPATTLITLALAGAGGLTADKLTEWAGGTPDQRAFVKSLTEAIVALGGAQKVHEKIAEVAAESRAQMAARDAAAEAAKIVKPDANVIDVSPDASGSYTSKNVPGAPPERPGLPPAPETDDLAGLRPKGPTPPPTPAQGGASLEVSQGRLDAVKRLTLAGLNEELRSVRAEIDSTLERQRRLEEMSPGSTAAANRAKLRLGDRAALDALPQKMAFAEALEGELAKRSTPRETPGGLQDETGRTLGPNAVAGERYVGPDRRTVNAGPPEGVTDRRLPADEQVRADLKTLEGIKAAREAAEKARELPRQKNGQTTEEVEPEHIVGVKELTHTLASTQMNMPDDLAKAFRSFGGSVIKSEDLTHNGVEHTPHVTVKYGLHGDDPKAVEALLADEPPVTVEIGKITHFADVEDGKADAVVAEVDSPDLHRLNAKIAKALPNTETYPDYKPHITIAYVKAGKGKDYDGLNTFDGNKLTLDTLTFTTPDGQAHQIPLGGSSETTRRVAARGSKFDHPTFHALTNDEDRTLYAALHSTEGATGRFDKLGQTGATDEELKAAISASFGIQGGSGGHRPLGVRAFDYKAMPLVGGRSEANPKFWYDKAATMGGAHGKPTLEGQKLIDAVRRVMQIPTKGSAGKAPAASPETSAPRPEFKPTWMNESDIDEAVERFKDDPVLGPAARFLNEFKDQVNRKSDGWPYWKQPGHAASRLMGVLHAYLRAGMGANPHQPKAVAEDIWSTMAPITAFMTRHGEKAGMTLPTLALEKPSAKSKPAATASSERDTSMSRRGFFRALIEGAKDIDEFVSDELMGDPELVAKQILEIRADKSPTPEMQAGEAKLIAWLVENGIDPDEALKAAAVPLGQQVRESYEKFIADAKAKKAARATYEDGRQKPIAGDKVYQTVRGFGGSPAYIHGEVYSAKGGELRVRTTGSAAVIGSAPVGKTYKLDPSWTVQGDPIVTKRREEREAKEKEQKETTEREHQEHVDAVTSKAALMVGTGKFEFLTKKTPVGARVWNEWREIWAKVDSQADFGPVLRDEEGGSDYTLGNADKDGTWAGYAVEKGAAAAAPKSETKEAPSEKPASVSAEAQPAETNPHKATVTYNSARHSIEVKFPDKPPLEILHGLRSDGFKWAKTNKLWYRSLPGVAADETAPAVKKALALVKQSVGVTTAAPPVAPSKQQEDLRAMSDADLALLSARGSPASKNLALEEIARRVKEAVKKPTVIPGLKEVAISKGAAADAYEKGDRVRFLGALGTVDEKVGDLLRVKMDDGTNRIVDARKLEYVSKTPEEQGHKTEGFINTKKAEPLSAADADLLRRRLKTLTHQRNGEAERYHKLLVAKATETTRKPVLENLKAIERDLNEVWTRLNAANALSEGYEHHPETQENASARVEEKAAAAGEKAKPFEDRLQGWTKQQAGAFLETHKKALTKAGFLPEIVGGVGTRGESANDLDIVLKPIGTSKSADRLEEAEEAFLEHVAPSLGEDREMLDFARSTTHEPGDMVRVFVGDDWKVHAGADTIRAVEFYLPDALYKDEKPKAGGQKTDFFAKAKKALAERKALAKQLAAGDDSVRLEGRDGKTALVGPDMSKPGAFRITWFDGDGEPWGHSERPSYEEAIFEALSEGYTPKKGVESTQEEASHAGTDVHRPGELPERGGRTTRAGGTRGKGALAPVLPEAGEGAGSAGPGRPGHGDSSGVTPDGVRGDAGDVEGRPAESSPRGVHVPESVSVPPAGDDHDPGVRPPDYGLTPERIRDIIGRGDVTRFADNVAAIKIIKTLEREQRWATPDEQAALAKYVGWGATELAAYLKDYEAHDWSANEKRIWRELRELTTEEEREALIRSSPNAHFTYELYRPIWAALRAAGFTGGRILEPAVGTGHAFGFMPAEIRAASTLNAVELDPLTAAIAHHLYPSARVQAVGYEEARISRGSQDLILSNVPFGDFGITKDLLMPEFLRKRIHNYFFAKALQHVRPGGLIAFVTSKNTLDTPTYAQMRQYVMEHAEFLGAVRLPNTAFNKSAKTVVVTDIVILRRLREGEKAQNAKLFIEARKHEGLSKELGERSYDASGRSSNVYRSSWYDAHPELVLGTESMTGTQNRRFQYTVTAKDGTDVLEAIATALGTILPPGSYEPVDVDDTPDGSHAPQPVQGSYKPGELRVSADGKGVVSVDRNGETVDVTPKRLNKETGKPVVDTSAVARIHGMISIRDARNALVAAMRRPDVTEKEIKQLQGALTFAYDKFVKPDSKAPNYLNSQINKRLFKNDPEVANLLALEKVQPKATIYTDKKGKQTLRLAYTVIGKTDIFTKRTIGADPTITHVDTPKDALLASLGTHGRLDWPYMARIFGAATKKAVAALKESLVNEGLVFEQPDGAYVLAEEYLSGDVVSKLEDIEGADHPERFAKSKAALETVRPAPKTEQSVIDGQVSIGLGSHWINPADLSTFVAEQIGVSEGHVAYQIVGTSTMVRWSVASDWEADKAATRHPLAVHYNGRHDENGNDIAGTTQSVYSFLDLVNDALNLKSPHLGHYEGQGDRRVFIREPKAELAARANQETLRAAWADYVFSHKDVLGRMLDTFNLRFNRTVPRTFDGSHMRYPGMATLYNAAGDEITFFPHQDNGVWRILSSGNTLLAHEVGAGKTFEMIAAAMEMRRTGRATKPMITVPTYLLKQWEQDIVRLYPSAKLLSFTEKDLSADKRQQAMARISHGDWDIVLVPHSSFGLLKVSDERLIAEMQRWIAELQALEDAHGTGGKKRKGDDPIKEAERQRRKLEDKVAAKMASLKDGKKDNALTWEQLGVDAVFVDEAQAFKNLFYFTKIENVRGLSRSESDRALDLYVKLLDINEQSHYRNVVLATATPVMNSIAEIYTMQRYLQPQTLKQHGVDNFDNWYAMFAQAVPTTERQPDGSYKEVMRLRKYQNLQLLSRITREVMDYVGWEDMPYLKLPKIRGGRIRIIETDKHPMYGVVKDWFTYRMDQLRQNPPHVKRDGTYEAPERHDPLTGRGLGRFDNILTVMTDAKKAAVDLRLVLGDRVKDWEGSRLQVAADEMVAEWKREKATKGLSLVFLDMGTPKEPPPLTFLANVAVEDETEGEMDEPTDEEMDALEAQVDDDDDLFNLYDALKAALVKRGIPANEIAYLHQAKNPAERVALFQAANDGRIRVLLASTDKGGVGMNVQERLSAIFELDVPRAQRPGDLRQRMGRGIRQGNLYKDVALVRFVTRDTTDEWLWGLLQTKDTQIRQFYRGDVSTLEEDDPSTMSLEEAQIRASADPRGIELTELKGKMARLEAQASAAERAVAIAKTDIGTATRMKGAIQAEKQQLEAWVASSFKTRRGKTFEMTVGGKSYTDRDDAGEALLDALRPIAKAEAKAKDATPVQVGAFGDMPIWAMFSGWDVRSPVLNSDGRPKMKDGQTVTERNHRVQVNVWMNGSEVGSFNPSATVVATPDPTDLTQLGKGQDPIASLVNSYERLPDYRESQQKEIEEANARISQAQNVLAHPSKAIEEFRLAKDRVVAIEEELKAESIEKEKARAAAGQPPKEGEAPTELGRSVYTSGFVVPEDSGEGALTARERATAAPTPYKTMLPEKPAAPYRAMGASEFQLITPVEETAHFWVYKNPEADKDSRWVVTHRGTGMSAYLTSTAAEAKAFAQAIDSGRFGDPAAFDFTDGASMPTEAKNIGRDALKAAKSGDLKPRQGLVEGEKGAVSLGLLPVHALAHDMIALSQWLSPKTGSSEAMLAGTDLVAHIAARDQHIVRAQRALDAARRAMDHWSHDESREFMRVMEGIAPAAALPPDQRQIAALFKQLIAQWTHEVTRRGLIHSFIQDYFPHIWEQKAQTQGILARLFFGRRPLAGREGFRKRRTIPTIEDGLAAGLTPVSWNPAVLLDAKIAEMAKSVMAHDLRHDWTKKHGLRKFVPNGMRGPDGWIPDKDRGTVYGPKNATVIVNAGQTQNKVTGALAFGRLVVGQYYLHPDAARLLERFLSRGLHGRSMLFDAFNQSGNLFTQVLLGWSTFHLWMTGIESAFSKAATAVEHFSRGELGAAARQAAWVGPQGIIRDLMRGYRYVHEFYADNGDANDITGVIGQIINAGGGFTWSHYEHADAVGKFVSNMRGFFGALHRGSALDAAVKGGRAVALAPFAAIELPTKLIMEHWVPYLKAAAFMDRAEMELRRLTAQGATLEQKRYTLQRSWDIVDDRFGQLRYDNLFWNNTFKQGLMASFLSVGWNVGSLRPIARVLPGQAKRLIKAAVSGGAGMPPTPPGGKPPKPPAMPAGGPYPGGFEPAAEHWLHPDMAWVATGAFMVAVAGALYHYLHTGQRPKDARDYYAPVADPDTGRRVNLISYAKDYLAWERHALTTASHKVRPILTMLWETWTNEDFFGVQIYNPDDPTKKQVEDVFKSWLARANPIAWQQAVKASEDGTLLDHLKEWGAQQLSPWRPAPAEISRSAAEELLHSWGQRTTVKTQEQAATQASTRAIRRGVASQAEVNWGDIAGKLTPEQIRRAVVSGARNESFLEFGFKQQPLMRALKLYEVATPEERAKLQPLLLQKMQRLSRTVPPNDVQAVMDRFGVAIDLPVAPQ